MVPRRALAERRKAAGHSQERLAELLSIDRSTVVRWEAGVTEPLPRLRPALARALAVSIDQLDQLLTTVSSADSAPPGQFLGYRPLNRLNQGAARRRGDGDVGLSYFGDIRATVAALEELARNDVQRRDFLRRAAFAAAASVAPSRDWLLAALDTTQVGRRRQIGNQEVLAIRRAFAMFQKADVHHGGGHARQALAQYVTEHVLPMLDDVDPDSDAGSQLFTAASEQIYLLGWTSFDDGRHALSQRYLLQALELARASGDIPLGSFVLAGMSAQARMLGHPREALQLAAAGRHGLREGKSAACMARLWEREAHAHASLGQHKDAARAVVRSQAAFEKVRPEDGPEWARFIDRAYLSGEWANAFIDMSRPHEAAEFADQSLADASQQRRPRRGALSHAALARVALCQPQADVERAVHNAHETLTLTTQVRSSRCVAAVEDLQRRLHPYKAVQIVRDFNERARVLFPAGV
jgi:transcriptional regulator with XRE-family HTH domain